MELNSHNIFQIISKHLNTYLFLRQHNEIWGENERKLANDLRDEILEQVEAGYISKEEHEKLKWQKEAAEEQINGYWKPNLERAKGAIEQLRANSIPKDRVREQLDILEEHGYIDDDRDWNIGIDYNDWQVIRQQLLGES